MPQLYEFIKKEKPSFSMVNLSLLLSVESHSRFDSSNESLMEEKYWENEMLDEKIGFFDSLYFAGPFWHTERLSKTKRKLKSSTVPTLILVNHHDPATPPMNGKIMLKDLEYGRLLVFDDTGHGVTQDECLLTTIESFFTNPKNLKYQNCLNLKP